MLSILMHCDNILYIDLENYTLHAFNLMLM